MMTSEPYSEAWLPPDYICQECECHGDKLWRRYQTFMPEVLCGPCVVKKFPPNDSLWRDRSSYLTGEGDQLGWFVPCVPTEDNSTYWGYTAVPQAGVEWWKRLPSSLVQEAHPPNLEQRMELLSSLMEGNEVRFLTPMELYNQRKLRLSEEILAMAVALGQKVATTKCIWERAVKRFPSLNGYDKVRFVEDHSPGRFVLESGED